MNKTLIGCIIGLGLAGTLAACGGAAPQTGIDLAALKQTCAAAAPALAAATGPGAPAPVSGTATYPYAFCNQLFSGATGIADQHSMTWLPAVLNDVQIAAKLAGHVLPLILPLL